MSFHLTSSVYSYSSSKVVFLSSSSFPLLLISCLMQKTLITRGISYFLLSISSHSFFRSSSASFSFFRVFHFFFLSQKYIFVLYCVCLSYLCISLCFFVFFFFHIIIFLFFFPFVSLLVSFFFLSASWTFLLQSILRISTTIVFSFLTFHSFAGRLATRIFRCF